MGTNGKPLAQFKWYFPSEQSKSLSQLMGNLKSYFFSFLLTHNVFAC